MLWPDLGKGMLGLGHTLGVGLRELLENSAGLEEPAESEELLV